MTKTATFYLKGCGFCCIFALQTIKNLFGNHLAKLL